MSQAARRVKFLAEIGLPADEEAQLLNDLLPRTRRASAAPATAPAAAAAATQPRVRKPAATKSPARPVQNVTGKPSPAARLGRGGLSKQAAAAAASIDLTSPAPTAAHSPPPRVPHQQPATVPVQSSSAKKPTAPGSRSERTEKFDGKEIESDENSDEESVEEEASKKKKVSMQQRLAYEAHRATANATTSC